MGKKFGQSIIFFSFVILLLLSQNGCDTRISDQNSETGITIFVGAASKPPVEELVEAFYQESGVKVHANFGGSGYMLAQMKLAGQSDIFLPGSSDYMEVAKNDGLIVTETEQKLAFLVPAINVRKGNPKKIRCLDDLLREDVRLVIANPEGVCLGAYTVEIFENHFSVGDLEVLRKKIVNYAESCSKTATAISMQSADAVVGWKVFESWDSENIETVALPAEDVVRISYIPIAITKFCKNREMAEKFIDFVVSEKGKAIFEKYNYFMSYEDARNWVGADIDVGGTYELPESWVN